MMTNEQVVGTMASEAERLLRRRDYRHAIVLYDSLLQQSPLSGAAWLGAAEAALEMGFGERALDLLKEPKPFYDQVQRERWVNLRSEALRRFGSSEEGIAFIAEWLNQSGPETQTKLLLRKATFHLLQKDTAKGQATTREAWESPLSRSPSVLPFAANVAFMSGLTEVAAQAGREMMRSGSRLAGLCVFLSSKFYGVRAPVVRVALFLFFAAMVFVPRLQPLMIALAAALALASLITWRRLRPFALSYAMPLVVVLAAFALLIATKLEPLGNAIGIAILLFIVGGAAVAFWRGKRAKPKRVS